MARERIKLILEIDLDPMPGMMHTPESAREIIEQGLQHIMGHYNPTVKNG